MKINAYKALLLENVPSSSGIVYDGRWFYLTVPGEYKIIRYDKFFHPLQWFETCRSYSYLCYDSKEHCFWAVQYGDSSYIYKLNPLFELIDTIYISIPEARGKRIMGISYNIFSDMLFLTFSKAIVSVNKYSLEDSIILYNRSLERIKGTVDIFGGFTGYCLSRFQDKIYIYSYSRMFATKINIPCELRVVSFCLGNIGYEYTQIHIYVLAIGMNGKQCILDYLVTNDSISQQEKYYCNKLDGIAFEGTKIADILNEEGEKLRELRLSSDDRKETLAVTRSICKTIHQMADIEYELYNKLLKLKKYCNFCND